MTSIIQTSYNLANEQNQRRTNNEKNNKLKNSKDDNLSTNRQNYKWFKTRIHNHFDGLKTRSTTLPEVNSRSKVIQRQSSDDEYVEELAQDRYLSCRALKRRCVRADGNCLFRALSVHIYDDENHHDFLRKTIVEYISENLNKYHSFILMEVGKNQDDDKADFIVKQELRRMKTPGEWTGYIILYAASDLFQRSLHVTMGGSAASEKVVTDTIKSDIVKSKLEFHVVWSRKGGGHYDAVIKEENKEPIETRENDSTYDRDVNTPDIAKDTNKCALVAFRWLTGLRSNKNRVSG